MVLKKPLANCLKFHTEGKMNLKQKKEYMAPEMEVVEMGSQTNLLQGSPEVDLNMGDDSDPTPTHVDECG